MGRSVERAWMRAYGFGFRDCGAGFMVEGFGIKNQKCRDSGLETRREFFIDDLLVRIHPVIKMIWWNGLAP